MMQQIAAARDMDELVYRMLLPVSISLVAMRVFLVVHSAVGPAMAIFSRVGDLLGRLPF